MNLTVYANHGIIRSYLYTYSIVMIVWHIVTEFSGVEFFEVADDGTEWNDLLQQDLKDDLKNG